MPARRSFAVPFCSGPMQFQPLEELWHIPIRGRVILGGLLAGLIINSIEFVTNYAARILATRVLVITALVSLADTVAGTLAGAWLCKEEAVTETPRSTGLLRQARGRLSTPAPFASSGNAPSA